MDTTTTNGKKPTKERAKDADHANLRVRKETARIVYRDLEKLNKKEFGRFIYAADYLALAVSLVRPEHLEQLQEGSLSNRDHFVRAHARYCEQHGKIAEDEYFGMIMRGEVPAPMASAVSVNSDKTA